MKLEKSKLLVALAIVLALLIGTSYLFLSNTGAEQPKGFPSLSSRAAGAAKAFINNPKAPIHPSVPAPQKPVILPIARRGAASYSPASAKPAGYQPPLQIHSPKFVSVQCPPGAILEGEPSCGTDYVDTYNGGCNSSPFVFQNVSCNTVICGTSGTYLYTGLNYRDTDWFRLVLANPTVLTFKVVADFPLQTILFDAGTENCSDNVLLDYRQVNAGDTATITMSLPAKTYWLWVGPSVFDSYPCPVNYVMIVDCLVATNGACCNNVSPYDCQILTPDDCNALPNHTFRGLGTNCGPPNPCLPGPSNDDCTGAIPVTAPLCPDVVTVSGSTVGATVDCPDVLAWNAVWYSFYLPYASNTLNIDFCPTVTPIYQVGIVLYNSCPPICGNYILTTGYQWVTCPNGNTGVQMWWSGLPAGTYYFPVAVWDYSMNPFMDFVFNACVEQAVAPANDNCENAEPVGDVTNLSFNTSGASFDGPGYCQYAPNIWYCYTATCNGVAHASLCGSSYDTKIAAYDGCACPPTAMLACNDDACGGYLQSEIRFPVIAGQTYLIEVGGFGSNTGSGVLSISCSVPTPGDNCSSPKIIPDLPGALPYSDVGQTTCGRGHDYDYMTCLNPYDGGEDMIYQLNVTSAFDADIILDPKTDSWTGIAIDAVCPPGSPCMGYSTNSGASPHGIYGIHLEPGTYYIMIDTWPSPDCIADFDLSITTAAPAPPNDECTGAPIINTYPQTVYGTTIGARADCPDVLNWNSVWYRFDVPYTCNNITVDFCATNNYIATTGIVLYNSCPPNCPAYIPASGYQWIYCPNTGYSNPQIWWYNLPAGSYWFPVYLGSPMDFGFTVTVDSCVPCDVVCPQDGVPEGEPTCYDGYIDNYNGGCNSTPYVWQDINCHTTICGTSGVYSANSYRDTDWFRVQAGAGTLTWKVVAEFPLLIFVMDAGSENCSDYTVLGSATANPCDTATLSFDVPAGVYWVWVGPSDWGNYPCGVEYVARLDCQPFGPMISVDPSSFDKVLAPGRTIDDTLLISNTGGDVLNYEISHNPANTWLSFAPISGSVLPSGSQPVTISFDASALGVGNYYDQLIIASNSTKQLPDTVIVPVHLLVELSPDIDVPPIVPMGVLPGCTMTKGVTVNNFGQGELRYQVAVRGNPPLTGSGHTQTSQGRVLDENQKRKAQDLFKSGAKLSAAGVDKSRLSAGAGGATPGTPVHAKGDTLFMQLPMTPDESWSFGTSDIGAGYKIYEDVWDVTQPISDIHWWGLCLIYSGGWAAGNPANLSFDITFYSDPLNATMPPTQVACTYQNVVPTVTGTGQFFVGFEMYAFDVAQLDPPCYLPAGVGWVSIQSKSAGQGYDWFLWASAETGDGYSYQEGNGDYYYDDALILTGGQPCPFTVSPAADTVPPGGHSDLVLTFDGTGFDPCANETTICYLIYTSNDQNEPVVTTQVDMWSGRGDVFVPTCLIDIGDVVYLVNYVLKNGPVPSPLCMGDCDPSHDGVIDMADLVYLIQYLYQAGQPPQVTPVKIHPGTIK